MRLPPLLGVGSILLLVRHGTISKGKVVALVLGLAVVIGLGVWGSPADGVSAILHPDVPVKAIPSFSLDIQPVFDRSCGQCHVSGPTPAGVDLSSYDGVMQGSVNGPIVLPGRPELSNLVAHLKKEADPGLWHKCSLSGLEPTPNQVKNLERWTAIIRQGRVTEDGAASYYQVPNKAEVCPYRMGGIG